MNWGRYFTPARAAGRFSVRTTWVSTNHEMCRLVISTA